MCVKPQRLALEHHVIPLIEVTSVSILFGSQVILFYCGFVALYSCFHRLPCSAPVLVLPSPFLSSSLTMAVVPSATLPAAVPGGTGGERLRLSAQCDVACVGLFAFVGVCVLL